jgi:hypothetical protein
MVTTNVIIMKEHVSSVRERNHKYSTALLLNNSRERYYYVTYTTTNNIVSDETIISS